MILPAWEDQDPGTRTVGRGRQVFLDVEVTEDQGAESQA